MPSSDWLRKSLSIKQLDLEIDISNVWKLTGARAQPESANYDAKKSRANNLIVLA